MAAHAGEPLIQRFERWLRSASDALFADEARRETGHAYTRLAVSGAIAAWLLVRWLLETEKWTDAAAPINPVVLAAMMFGADLAILTAARRRWWTERRRVTLSITADPLLLSAVILSIGPAGLALTPIYALYSLDTGTRFGRRRANWASAVSTGCYLVVAWVQGLWGVPLGVALSLASVILVAGLYVVGFKTILDRANATLEAQSMRDVLTGLHNRHFFDEHLKRVMWSTRRNRLFTACIFIDLDGFKAVNDTWGHAIGDALLQEVARRILAATRDSDLVGRMGGDEFAIATDCMRVPQDAIIVARRILGSIRSIDSVEGCSVEISASMGISWFVDDELDPTEPDVEALIHNADQAMYAAKHSGKDAIVMIDPIGRFEEVQP